MIKVYCSNKSACKLKLYHGIKPKFRCLGSIRMGVGKVGGPKSPVKVTRSLEQNVHLQKMTLMFTHFPSSGRD